MFSWLFQMEHRIIKYFLKLNYDYLDCFNVGLYLIQSFSILLW